MMPTERFEVGDRICGAVDHFSRLAEAAEFALAHQHGHFLDGDAPIQVEVYDRMARRGMSELWHVSKNEFGRLRLHAHRRRLVAG